VGRLKSGFKLRLKVQWKFTLCQGTAQKLVSTFLRCHKPSQSWCGEKKKVSDIANSGYHAENNLFLWNKNTWLHCFQIKYCSLLLGVKNIVVWSTTVLACFLCPQRKLSTKYHESATGRSMSITFLCRHLCTENIPHRINELLAA